MEHEESIRKKITRELKYYRVQNIRLLQEVEELEGIVKHNTDRLARIEHDREQSERLVKVLRSMVKDNGQ